MEQSTGRAHTCALEAGSPAKLSCECDVQQARAPRSRPATAALVGYARESIGGPPLNRQLRALSDAGCTTVFTDAVAGRTAERPQLTACLASLRTGDTFVVPSLERLTHSVHELIRLVAGLQHREIGFHSLQDDLDTRSSDGRLVFPVFAALAALVREASAEGAREGRAIARAGGQRLGRPPVLTPAQINHARRLLQDPDATVASVARQIGTGRSNLYRALPELTGRRPRRE